MTTGQRTRVQVRGDLRALSGYHSPQVDVAVRLNANESPFAPPPAWRAELDREMAALDWNRYPDRGATELRRAIAEWHGVGADHVFAANGSNEVLQTLLLAFAGPGRTVVTFEPTYQLHSHIARLTGATVVEGERRSDFTLDPAELRRVVESSAPAVTFLCSPNNPTGLVEPRARVEELLEVSSGLVVVDEAYAQFAAWTALDMIDDGSALAVVRTFSKTWSMAAARLGYLIAPPWLVAELDKVVLPYHLDAVTQLAGRLALRHVDEMGRRVEQIIAGRELVTAGLRALGVTVAPSGANFVLFRPVDRRGAAVWQSLVRRGVLVRDCSSWPRLDDWLRVTIGSADDNARFLAALTDVLSEAPE